MPNKLFDGKKFERREKILYLHEDTALKMFNAAIKGVPPLLAGLPDDVFVVMIHHEWERRAWALVLWSEEWEVVPDKTKPPELMLDEFYRGVDGQPQLTRVEVTENAQRMASLVER